MIKLTFFYLILLAGYVSCCASMSYSLTPTGGSGFVSSNTWQSISAAITGAVLSSSSFLFFIRRLVGQYDDKHARHEKEITELQQFIKNLDVSLFNKLHEQIEDIRQELQKTNENSTSIIIKSIKDIKNNLQSIVTDITLLKEDRKRCVVHNDKLEQNSNDIIAMSVKYESLNTNVNKIEKQIDRHIEFDRKSKN